jgi:hypothetical protein
LAPDHPLAWQYRGQLAYEVKTKMAATRDAKARDELRSEALELLTKALQSPYLPEGYVKSLTDLKQFMERSAS